MRRIVLLLLLNFICHLSKSQSVSMGDRSKIYFVNFTKAGFFMEANKFKNTYKIDESNIFKTSRFLFFGNGLCYYCNLGIVNTDSSNYKNICNKIVLKSFYGASWGKFKLFGDTIKAHFRFQFFAGGLRMKYYDVHFQGTIRGCDTIENWKMSPPYPKPNRNLNEQFDSLLLSKTLIFVPHNAKKLIDSNKVWINQYDESYWKY